MACLFFPPQMAFKTKIFFLNPHDRKELVCSGLCDSCRNLAIEQPDLERRRFESNPQQIPPRKGKLDPAQADTWGRRDPGLF